MPDRDRPPSLLHLVKYQALGNDYLVVDLSDSIGGLPDLAVRLCDRHLGIGADGLLAFDPDRLALRVFRAEVNPADLDLTGRPRD